MKLKIGNWYKVKDLNNHTYIAQYCGREEGFECSICHKGSNAHCFNRWYKSGEYEDYETFAYGTEHLPEIIEDLGESDNYIYDKEN